MRDTSAHEVRIIDNRLTVQVLHRQKPVATVIPGEGLEVYCKVYSMLVTLSFEQMMSIPSFRAGVLAVLAKEASRQRTVLE
jgi:hypothetical protein